MLCVVNDSKLNNLIRLDAAQNGRIAIQEGMMRSLYADVCYIKWRMYADVCHFNLWLDFFHDDLWLDVCDVMMLVALRSEKRQLEQKEGNDEDGSIENKIDPTGAADSIDVVKSTDGDAMKEVSSVDYAALIKVRLVLSI